MTSKISHSDCIPQDNAPPPQVMRLQFTDAGQIAEAMGWDLDFRQLERGRLLSPATVLNASRLQVMKIGFNRRLHQCGCSPKNRYTFGIPVMTDGDFQWFGSTVSANDLINFERLEGFEGVTGEYRGTTISLDCELLDRAMRAEGFDGDIRLLLNNVSIVPAQQCTEIRHILASAALLTESGNEMASGPVTDLLARELAASLARTLLDAVGSCRPDAVRSPRLVTRRALDVFHDSDDWTISVGELCRRMNCSPSTLQRAFLREFGVPTKAYLLSARLSRVRDALATAPDGTRIVDVANRWGFWHMGQFAAAFRRQFGCTPSELLAVKHH